MAGAAGGAAGGAGPALAAERAFSDFDVRFLGLSLDHKALVWGVILGQAIGFVGALAGGNSARKKKEEVQRLNAELQSVNSQLLEVTRQLRLQVRGKEVKGSQLPVEKEGKTEAQIEMRGTVLAALKSGKNLLKEKDFAQAKACFEEALSAIRVADGALDSPWKAERKAYRGLGGACEGLGMHRDALEHMQQVVAMSKERGDDTGLGDAYGVIADICTEMGDYAQAAEYYDLYIADLGDPSSIL